MKVGYPDKWTLLIFVLLSGLVIAQSANEPKAVVKPMSYDFGDIVQDSVFTTFYVITNEGGDLLEITKVNASCGCTAVMSEKNELKPGESANIKVSFNSKGRTGKQSKIITVETNDPHNPAIKLALTGNVIKKN
ncbi:MAG TPA: hypothetical protein DHV28_04205 [Ignavibacteriales bacterium]|nr:hypothetical protein [Ignavibacteriales bacterium]